MNYMLPVMKKYILILWVLDIYIPINLPNSYLVWCKYFLNPKK